MRSGPSDRAEVLSLDVAIVGAGFGGLCMAIKLLEAGRDDFIVLEKGAEVGGTWRDNTYPGCGCDVQSHLYSYSFAGNPNWTRRFPAYDEIQRYILDTTERFGLRPHIRFGQELCSARFDETVGRWHIRTKAGLRISARSWVLATGPLHHPHIPQLPGLDRFKGEVFHSARWNHDYDLLGKRVVSIGTGASAIQYVPKIAPKAAQLHVMQRTPAWVIPRDTRSYSDVQKRLFAAVPALRKAHRAQLYWRNEARVAAIFNPKLAALVSLIVKQSIRFQVRDRDLAAKLTPDYLVGCKRVLISNDWFPAFNRPNVELVSEGIREVREHSVVTADGVERQADCLIFGTGFVVDPRNYMHALELTGVGGRRLQDDWRDGAEAYLGVTVSGYPNMFQLVGPNTGLGHNSVIFMLEAQVRYVIGCLALLDQEQAQSMNVRPGVQQRYNEALQADFPGTVWASGCESWYKQADGKNVTIWPRSTWRYWLQMRRVRRADYELSGYTDGPG